MTVSKSFVVVLAIVGVIAASPIDISENQVESRSIQTGEELVSQVVDNCFTGDVDYNQCVRSKVLAFLGGSVPEGKSLEDNENVDEVILDRVTRYLNTHKFKVQMPEFLFQNAQLTFRPAKGLSNFKVSFPKEEKMGRSMNKARGVLKKKLLLPVILIVKLLMKALTPLFLLINSIKATKALILSKVAIGVVIAFVVMQMMNAKKMMMPMMPEIAPTMAYGPPPPAPAMPYGPPSAPASPPSSYEPGWEPSPPASASGPYSRVWDSHQAAYSGYYNAQPLSDKSVPSSSSTY